MAITQLRGKLPTSVKKRLKAMFYGSAGCGKTTAAMQFPKPYFIDTEKGAENDQYVALLERNGGALFQTQDYEDLYKEIRTLATIEHSYQTVVIDPITSIYSKLVDECTKKVGAAHGKNYSEANKMMKRLIDLLMKLDMNVIITSHVKNEYGAEMAVIGQTFDAYKKLDYIFDLVLEIKQEKQDRFAIVKKSRIEQMPVGDTFKFNYKEIASRYDETIIEKASAPIDLISDDNHEILSKLIKECKISDEQLVKWLTKYNLADISELSNTQALRFIESLNKRRDTNEF